MEIKIKEKENNKSEKGLIALKKEELVNIILRKDDVEKKLKTEIEELKDELSQTKDIVNGLEDQTANDKAELFVLKNMNKRAKKYNTIITIVYVIVIVIITGCSIAF